MRFNPSTEDEIEARAVWARGVYPFRIVDAEEGVSAAGNEMIEVKIEITKRDGQRRIIRDYLLAKRPAKLLHAATVCGLIEKYEAGEVDAEDFIGKSGNLKLGIQTSKQWPTKNVVSDYV
jgi:hypothetical protein